MNATKVNKGLIGAVVTGLFSLLATLPMEAVQSVTLAWNRNSEPDISGYILYYGGASGVYTNASNVGNVTNATAPGLLEGSTYYFVVTAVNTSGLESDPSNEVNYSVPTGTTSNQPPVLTLATNRLAATKNTARAISGLQVSDPDAGSGNLSMTFSASRGTITVLTTVPSGVVAGNITFNGSGNVLVTAPLAALNATLSRSNGVSYTGALNLVGADTLTISVNDNGNTGLGGAKTDTHQITLEVTGDNLDVWRNSYFTASDLADSSKQSTLWGDLADPDRDGRNNLQEYALARSAVSRESGTNGIFESYEDVGGRKCFTLSFRKRTDDPLLQYIPMVTTNDLTWMVATNQLLTVSTSSMVASNVQLVKYQEVPSATNVANRRYYLRILRNAVEASTESFVAGSTVIKGTAGRGDKKVSMFSLPMVGQVVYAGTVTGLGTNKLTDTNATWQPGQFGTNGAYYLEFDSGLMADILLTDSTNKSLLLYGDLRASVTNGFAYRIRKHSTIASVFGPRNEAGLSEQDEIQLQLPNGAASTIYYNSNYTIWLSYADPDIDSKAGSTAIYPEQGIIIIRRDTRDLKLYFHGLVKESDTQVPIHAGYNLVGTVKATKSIRLADLNLYSGKPDNGVMAAANSTDADNLMIYDSNSIPKTYWLNTYNNGWWDMDVNPADDVLIQPGSAFFIWRKAPRAAFLWTIPSE